VYWLLVRRRLLRRSVPLALAALLVSLGCTPAPRPVLPETGAAPDLSALWEEPPDITARDLYNGPGGPALAPPPGTTFTFISRKTTGFSPGYDVRDIPGMKWSVKYGPEAQSEVVASRITWALGYHQPAVYYVEKWRLVGGDVAPDAAPPARFRPELPGWRRAGSWEWGRNPFVGSQPFRGLVVLMHILNNWDLLDRNTAIYELGEPPRTRQLFVVQDLGASFGHTGTILRSGSRNDVADFEEQGFIKGVDGEGFVRFDDTRWKHERLYRHITPADVRWTCVRLSRLTARQWTDAFASARYEPAVAGRFIRRLQDKVRTGLVLGGDVPDRLAVAR